MERSTNVLGGGGARMFPGSIKGAGHWHAGVEREIVEEYALHLGLRSSSGFWCWSRSMLGKMKEKVPIDAVLAFVRERDTEVRWELDTAVRRLTAENPDLTEADLERALEAEFERIAEAADARLLARIEALSVLGEG